MKKHLLILLPLLIFVFTCDENPTEPEILTGNITGKVTDSSNNDPIVGATITTNPITSSVNTDGTGDYTIPDLDPSEYVVTVSKSGYGNKSVNVSVTANHNSTADIQMDPVQPELGISVINLNFGTTNTTMVFNIINTTGFGSLQWSLSENADWLTVSPLTGTTTNELDQITAIIDRAGLGYGNFTSIIEINSNGGNYNLDVVMTVQNPNAPQLTVDRQFLDFGDIESSQQFNIDNTGSGELSWNIAEGYSWLTVTPDFGTTTTEVDAITVFVDRSGLDPTTYNGSISITSNGGNTSISISMIVAQESLPAPYLNTPTAPNSNSVQLTWTQIDHPDFNYYRIYRSFSPGVTEQSTMITEITNNTTTSYNDSGLQPSTLYYYKVYVYSTGGASTPSNEVSITTPGQMGTWVSALSLPDGYTVNGIDFISSSVGYAITSSHMYKWNSSDWQLVQYESTNLRGNGLCVISNNNIWYYRDYYIYNYSNFLNSNNMGEYSSSYSIYAVSEDSVWVGRSGKVYLFSDIDNYQEFSLNADYVKDFYFIDSELGWCIDSNGKIYKWNNFGWSNVVDLNPSNGYDYWTSITATSENDIWAVGDKAWHYDGANWTESQLPFSSSWGWGINDIWALSTSDVWAVTGDSSNPLLHYNGFTWSTVAAPVSKELYHLCMLSSTEGWAGGYEGTIIRYVQ